MNLLENFGKETINNISNNLSNLQSKFMESTLYKVVDKALDCGIRILLPNFIENDVIEVKDAIMENGLISGVKQVANSIINFGSDVYGMATGKFTTVEQMENIIAQDGTISKISGFLDEALEIVNSIGIIDSNAKTVLKSGKNTILDNIKNNISEEFTVQKKYLNQVEKYANEWKEAYELQDVDTMSKTFDKLEKYIEKVLPLQGTMKIYNEIKTVQEILENNREKFDFSENELELIKAFAN